MRKLLTVLIALLFLGVGIFGGMSVWAAEQPAGQLASEDVNYNYDEINYDNYFYNDPTIFAQKDRPYMPGDPEVRIIKFQVGSNQYTIQDGTNPEQTFTMDVAPYKKWIDLGYVKGYRVMLPAYYVAKAMGGGADYYKRTGEIGVYRPGSLYDGKAARGSITINFFPNQSFVT